MKYDTNELIHARLMECLHNGEVQPQAGMVVDVVACELKQAPEYVLRQIMADNEPMLALLLANAMQGKSNADGALVETLKRLGRAYGLRVIWRHEAEILEAYETQTIKEA